MLENKNPPGEKHGTVLLVPILCVGLSALAVVPFFFMGESEGGSNGFRLRMPVTHDMILHFDQMKSFHTGLSSGEVYPRWEEDTNRGFGAPTTSYYPPGVYYLTSGLYAIAGDWMVSLLIAHLMMMVGAGAAIYVYARRLMNRAAAIATMVAYIFLPYHLVDQYQRGAMAELLGFVFMPLMLLFGERLLLDRSSFSKHEGSGAAGEEAGALVTPRWGISSGGLLSAVGLAVTLGAFLWSHPPTAYQFMMAFGLFLVLFAWMHQSWKGLPYIACAITLGLGLSAAYVYPALAEQDLIRHDYVSAIWPYHDTYVFVHNLHYANTHRAFFDLIDFIWLFNGLAILIGALALLKVEPHFLESAIDLRDRVLLWVIVGFFATFMMTKASYPIGKLIPRIETGVFTWRMLSITTLVAALVAGACTQAALTSIKQRTKSDSNSVVSLASLIIIGGTLFLAVRLLPPSYQADSFKLAEEHVNFAMVPRTAPEDPLQLPKVDRVEFAKGRGQISITQWHPQHRSLLAVSSEPDKLLIRTFNFPGWMATVDGEPAQITTGEALRVEFGDSQQTLIRADTYQNAAPVIDGREARVVGREPLGDIVLELPAGAHHVTLDYDDTSARHYGEVVTILSSILVGLLVLLSLLARMGHKENNRDSVREL